MKKKLGWFSALDLLLDTLIGLAGFCFGLYYIFTGMPLLGVQCLLLCYIVEIVVSRKVKEYE